jgi:MFS family permease
MLLVILSYIDRAVLSLFGPVVQRDLGISDSQMGLLYGLGFIAPFALLTLLVGWAIDRYNRVLILLAGLCLWSVMTAGCGLVSSFALLLVCRGGVGAGEAVVSPAGYALIADRFSPERRGRAVGMVAASVSMGTGIALVVGSVLLNVLGSEDRTLSFLGTVHGWQVAFVLLGLLGVPLAILVMTLKDPRPVVETRSVQTVADLRLFLRRERRLLLAIFGCGVINVSIGTGIIAWTPTLLVRRFDVSPGDIGYLLGVTSVIGGVIGAPLAAELSDRWMRARAFGGRLRAHATLFTAMLAGIVVMATGTSSYQVAAGYIVVATVLAAINALSYAAVQDISPSPLRGRMLALVQFATLAFGYGSGPSLVAFVTDYVFKDPQAIGWSLLIVGVPLCLLAIALAQFNRAYYPLSGQSASAVHTQ